MIAGGTPGSITPTFQAEAIASAAAKYGVPLDILGGVYGQETSFGKNIATSSAGAVGAFQFTAADKGTGVLYPMTNTPTPGQFQQQADAAAAYLASLYRQHGSWDGALQAYSGGGYGLSQVQAQIAGVSGTGTATGGVSGGSGGGLFGQLVNAIAASTPAGLGPTIATAIGGTSPGQIATNAANDVIGPASTLAQAVGTIVGDLTNPSVWLRILEFAGGAVLVYMALKALTGVQGPDVVGTAAKVIR